MIKRIVIVFLALLILYLCGCTNQSENIQQPVNFYYHNNLSSEENFDRIIVPEIHEGLGYSNEDLITQYLNGPNSNELENPFPQDLGLISLTIDGKRVIITLSAHLSQLSGIDLTLACSCLSTTLFDMYDCQVVEINSDGLLINGKTSVVIHKEDLVLFDSSYVSESE